MEQELELGLKQNLKARGQDDLTLGYHLSGTNLNGHQQMNKDITASL